MPSSPDFQKNSLLSVTSGSRRPLDSVTPRSSLPSTKSRGNLCCSAPKAHSCVGRHEEFVSGDACSGARADSVPLLLLLPVAEREQAFAVFGGEEGLRLEDEV